MLSVRSPHAWLRGSSPSRSPEAWKSPEATRPVLLALALLFAAEGKEGAIAAPVPASLEASEKTGREEGTRGSQVDSSAYGTEERAH